MLATFLVGSATTVLGDDTGYAGDGRFAFQWESWAVDSQVQITPAYQSPAPVKLAQGNADRKLAFRVGQSLGTLAAICAFLKSIDALVNATGTLTLQPDATKANTLTYANAVLKSATLVANAANSAGMRVGISYKFEALTVV
ncbi:MAG: hypothetical protein ABSE16_18410 [Verrucomicrobiota bacterium]|jgi:hypothetical protein